MRITLEMECHVNKLLVSANINSYCMKFLQVYNVRCETMCADEADCIEGQCICKEYYTGDGISCEKLKGI